MTPSIRLTLAGIALTALIAGCQQPPAGGDKAAPAEAAATAIPASADVHPFTVGALQLASLRDGEMAPPVAEAPWPAEGAAAALKAAGLSGDTVPLSIQPLLVRDGDRVVLIDSGAGGQMGTQNKLLASLRAAGVEPAQVTDVLISHAHGDHVGGLVNAQNQLNFPNAVIRMSAPEWAFAQAGAEAAGAGPLLAAITPKVQPFEPGAKLTPSITAVALAGHTPGHSGYEIVSDGQRLLYFGDAMHSSVISVAQPDLVNKWDSDGAAGAATRRDLLNRGSSAGLRYYGVHFPWPGVGQVRHEGEGYAWSPAT